MHFTVITLFPEMFPGTLGHSLAGKALAENKWQLEAVNLRDFAPDKHQTVDDRPFGGGAGMVIKPDVLGDAITTLSAKAPYDKMIYFSPRGERLNQNHCRHLISCKRVLLIAGRYEGIDERVLDEFPIIEYSLGDFVLSGGELPALALMDSCVRLLPGVVGDDATHLEESFGDDPEFTNLLEYPHFTRPVVWQGRKVPDVLLSGNHQQIRKWRVSQAREITRARRPDLLDE